MEDEESDIEIREEDVIKRARERLKDLTSEELETMTERKFRSLLAEDFDVDDLDELKAEISQEVDQGLNGVFSPRLLPKDESAIRAGGTIPARQGVQRGCSFY